MTPGKYQFVPLIALLAFVIGPISAHGLSDREASSPIAPHAASTRFDNSPIAPRAASTRFDNSPIAPRAASTRFDNSPIAPHAASTRFDNSPIAPRAASTRFDNSPIAPQNAIAAPTDQLTTTTDTTIRLSLAQAIEIALAESPIIQIAEQTIYKQRYANAQVAASLYPQVNINATYGYTIKKPVMYFSLPGMGTQAIEMGRTHNIQMAASATMPIIAPQLWESIAINRGQLQMSLEKARSSRIEMIAEVKKAYMAALLADASFEVFQKSYDNASQNLEDIQAKYDQGLIAEFDKIRAEVQVKNLEPNLLQASNGRELAYDRLKVLLSLDIDQPIALTERLKAYADQIYDQYLYTRDTDVSHNSAIRQLAIQDTLLLTAIRLKKQAYIPTLSLQAVYDYTYANDALKLGEKLLWTPHSAINLSLSIPIFSAGKRYYGLKESQTDRAILRLQQSDAQQKVLLAIKQQQALLSTATKRYSASLEAVRGAELGYSIAKKRYSTGVGTLLEVNDANIQLLQAELNYDQSIYDFMIALADLHRLTGQREDIPSSPLQSKSPIHPIPNP